MSQGSIKVRFQILAKKAEQGDQKATAELIDMAVQFLKDKDDPEAVQCGINLLEDLSNLASLEAKRKLADCCLRGNGTNKQPYKVLVLLTECYRMGDQTVLAEMYSIAMRFLSASDRAGFLLRRFELLVAVDLLMFAAEHGHSNALIDFAILGEWHYNGIAPYAQDTAKGIAILTKAAAFGDRRARDNISNIGANIIKTSAEIGFKLLSLASSLGDLGAKCDLAVCFLVGLYGSSKNVEYSIKLFADAASVGNEDAQLNLHVLANHFLAWETLEPDYGLQQDVPIGLKILHYLEKCLQDDVAHERLRQIRAMKMSVPKSREFELEYFTGVLERLHSHVPRVPIQEIICEYLPEINPVFFQYKNAPKPEDESVLLRCLQIEQASCSSVGTLGL